MDAYTFDFYALLAKYNRLVRRLFHKYCSVDIPRTVFRLLHLVDGNAHAVRNFVVATQQHLFANNLGHKIALRLVCEIVFLEVQFRTVEVFF